MTKIEKAMKKVTGELASLGYTVECGNDTIWTPNCTIYFWDHSITINGQQIENKLTSKNIDAVTNEIVSEVTYIERKKAITA